MKIQQSHIPDVLQTQATIIFPGLAFEFHAPQTHPDPAVQGAVHIAARRPLGGEVITWTTTSTGTNDTVTVVITESDGTVTTFTMPKEDNS